MFAETVIAGQDSQAGPERAAVFFADTGFTLPAAASVNGCLQLHPLLDILHVIQHIHVLLDDVVIVVSCCFQEVFIGMRNDAVAVGHQDKSVGVQRQGLLAELQAFGTDFLFGAGKFAVADPKGNQADCGYQRQIDGKAVIANQLMLHVEKRNQLHGRDAEHRSVDEISDTQQLHYDYPFRSAGNQHRTLGRPYGAW